MQIGQISVRNLILWTLAFGVACAALLNASETWDLAIRFVNTGLLLLAPLVALLRPGSARATWAGFAIFGWAYYVLSLPAFDHADTLFHPHRTVRHALIRLGQVRKYPPFAVGSRVDVLDYSNQPPVFVRGTIVRGIWLPGL